jgi:hypothetical protein
MSIDDVLNELDTRQGVNGDGEVRFCECAELVIYGVRVPSPRGLTLRENTPFHSTSRPLTRC